MRIPAFVLKKLYVQGSLQRESGGLRFVLRNSLASATLTGMRHLQLDGQDVAPGQVAVSVDGQAVEAERVSPERPVVFGRGKDAEVRVRGVQPGRRARVRVEVESAEFGALVIEFEDDLP
jgi:hypothetical protein